MKVGLVYDPVYLTHNTGLHVEIAKRLEWIISYLEQTGLRQQLVPVEPRAATIREIALIHQRQYISHIEAVAKEGGGWLDADTVMSANSYEAAVYAAGGAIKATEAVIDNTVNSVFALVRPPGHHSTRDQAMGFCLFNNIAIATRYAIMKYGLERVAIIDFDVHHGNGTQSAFYDDPKVLYISVHESPFFPGTGFIQETGSGLGRGTTVNIPLPPRSSDSEYLAAFEQVIVPATARFRPQLIMVSAGYDCHWVDDMAYMLESTTGFAKSVQVIKDLADACCSGRIVMVLEGGYHPLALPHSVKATFDVLLGETNIEDLLGDPPHDSDRPDVQPLLTSIRELHGLS